MSALSYVKGNEKGVWEGERRVVGGVGSHRSQRILRPNEDPKDQGIDQ